MATGALDANGIWQYGEDDSETTFSALLNKLGSSTSTTVTRLEEMSGLTNTQAATARANLRVGLVPISPTTVTIGTGTGSFNALGQVSFTGATSVQLDGVFSADYKNYCLVINAWKAANAELRLRYAAGGTVKSTSYYWGRARAAANVLDNYSASAAAHETLGLMGDYIADGGSGRFDIGHPYDTDKSTTLEGAFHSIVGGYGCTLIGGSTYRVNERVDGLYIFPASGTFNGTIQVFGYND